MSGGMARWLPAMPLRYALVVFGGGLLLEAAQGADGVVGYIAHDWWALVVFAATVGGLACLLLAASGPTPQPLHMGVGKGAVFDAAGVAAPSAWQRRVRHLLARPPSNRSSPRGGRTAERRRRLGRVGARGLGLLATALAVALAFGSVAATDGCIYLMQGIPLSRAYINDVISFTYTNAKAALAGHNPYTNDSAFGATLQRFPVGGATPMRRGLFGHGFAYPLKPKQARIERLYVRWVTGPAARSGAPDPTGSAFDPRTLHSYPALSFLLYVPLIWLGVQNVLVLHVVVFAALFAWLVWIAPPKRRRWAALAAASAMIIPYRSLNFDSEIICLAFLLLAWHYRRNRWVSVIALGLGCAFKQYCWLFAPFILLDAWLTYGWREAWRRAGLTLAVFLAPNLPYLIASPGAWLTSMALPVSDPLFPMGMGLITLSLGGWLPFLPTLAYSALALVTLAGALWAYARWRPQLGEAALLLALLPLFFAWRSPANYFAIAPWLALYAAHQWYLREPNPASVL